MHILEKRRPGGGEKSVRIGGKGSGGSDCLGTEMLHEMG